MRILTKQEKRLLNYFCFTNSVAFRDRYMIQATGKFYRTRLYQIPSALSDDCIMFGGRSIGKSYDLEFSIVKDMLNHPNEESLLTAFRRTHIKDREEQVIGYLNNVPYFRLFFKGVNRSARETISRSPIYRISLRNGHVHVGISVGDDPAAIMIQGHHPGLRYMEEGQAYPRSAWNKFQSAIDPRGSVDRFYGTVDGVFDSPFRDLDGRIDKYKHVRFHIPRILEPHFDQKTKQNLIETLGGEKANEYLQQVLAEWGEPVLGLWDEAAIVSCFDKEEDPEYKGLLKYRLEVIEITKDGYKDKKPLEVLYRLPQIPDDFDVIIGIDAGYSSPTVILPFFWHNNQWNLHTRVMLTERMIFEDQCEIINFIVNKYNAILGIDCSSAEGKALATILLNIKGTYKDMHYDKRLIWIEFQSTMVIGYKNKKEEITQSVKEGTTIILGRMFENKQFKIRFDEQILEEFNAEHRKPSLYTGKSLIITPRTIHIPEAFRCFAYVYHEKHGKIERPRQQSNEIIFPSYQKLGFRLFGR